MSTNLNIQQFTLFPTEIFLLKLENLDTNNLIQSLKKVQQQDPKGVNKSNMGGWQSKDNLQNVEEFKPLCAAIRDLSNQLFENTYNIKGLWGNISNKYHYNNIHNHGYPSNENEWSGIFYLKVNPNSGALNFWEFNISPNGIPFLPENNHLILFPSYVKHGVDANQSNEERISLAFNISLS